MKLKLISCEVFHREMCSAVARSPHQVDMAFLPKGLHDLGSARMRAEVQATVDAVDRDAYDAIIFGYGLCNNGLHHVVARELPMVLPRAHDCITLFFGSKERYLDYFQSHLGTYFKTTGWMERGTVNGDLQQLTIAHELGMDQSYEDMVEKYGKDNAEYLYETFRQTAPHYSRYTFIEMGIEPNDSFERQARDEATERDWSFEKVKGDMALIERLVNGEWDDAAEFLVVQPGWRVAACHDKGIVTTEPAA